MTPSLQKLIRKHRNEIEALVRTLRALELIAEKHPNAGVVTGREGPMLFSSEVNPSVEFHPGQLDTKTQPGALIIRPSILFGGVPLHSEPLFFIVAYAAGSGYVATGTWKNEMQAAGLSLQYIRDIEFYLLDHPPTD